MLMDPAQGGEAAWARWKVSVVVVPSSKTPVALGMSVLVRLLAISNVVLISDVGDAKIEVDDVVPFTLVREYV